MPFVSEAQRRYFNYNKDKLQKQGVNVDEWNKATQGKKLPERVKGSKSVDKHARFKRQVKAAFPKGY